MPGIFLCGFGITAVRMAVTDQIKAPRSFLRKPRLALAAHGEDEDRIHRSDVTV